MTLHTVSLLMTDLVGSTDMSSRLGPVAAEELRRGHFGLLRGAIKRHRGEEVKSLGDGLMVVFQNPSEALACAVDMQQSVDAGNRRSAERCEMRVAVSFGEVAFDEGDYYGDAAVEAARLCALARGGQILATALAHRIAGTREQYSFVPLGELELKGLSAVETVELAWQPVLASGLPLPDRLSAPDPIAYVGRLRERATLTALWEDAQRGDARLALVGGEAGVGKTRLATQFAQHLHEQGASVLYGRCDEDLGVPYQPWLQALGHLVEHAPESLLEWHVERHGADLMRLVPALRERLPSAPEPSQSDPETERYMMYAAVANLIAEVATQGPLLIILDDLHWADAPTLSLLRHVTAAGVRGALMLGNYRASELPHDHPLSALLADMHREQGVSRIGLSGLELDGVLALIESVAGRAQEPDARQLATRILGETSGNPFFVLELLRHLRESGGIEEDEGGRWRLARELEGHRLPQSVIEVTSRRIARLGPEAGAALSAASVIGRDFDSEVLGAVLETPANRLLDLLEGAVEASVLQESSERAGRFTFTHALVEHALYEALSSTRRARLHLRVAEVLEERFGAAPEERLGELATHWAAAVTTIDIEKAVRYAHLAAERALEQLAPAEAARWFGKALELAVQAPGDTRPLRCELLIGLGEAQRQVGEGAFRRTLLDAAALARDLGDADHLARAVLANNRGWSSNFGDIDTERVQALEAAAATVPVGHPLRAEVLGMLASELEFGGQSERCEQLSEEAIELARATGDQPVLARTIATAGWAIVAPQTLPRRRRLVEELGELALHLEDPRLRARTAARRALVALESGDRGTAEAGLATVREVADLVPEPWISYLRLLLEFGWALLAGNLAEAEWWASEACEAGTAAGQPDASLFFGAHIFHLRYFEGRAGELAESLMSLGQGREATAGFPAGAATLALIQDGRHEEARAIAVGAKLEQLQLNEAWSITMMLWAEAFAHLGVQEGAAQLLDMLSPFAGQLAVSGSHVYGSMDWAIALLACSLSRYDLAARHFSAAAEIETRLGAQVLLARTQVHWAAMLISRGSGEHAEYARTREDTEHAQTREDTEHAQTREDAEYAPTREDTEHAQTREDAEYAPTREDAEHAQTRGDAEYAQTRGDAEYAQTLLERAQQVAETVGAHWIARQAAEVRAEMVAAAG